MKNLQILSFVALLFIGLTSCDKPDENCICTLEYAPVCGTDGQVYSNSCEASCKGVEIANEGFCSIETTGKIIDLGDITTDGCGFVLEVEEDGNVVQYHPETDLDASLLVHELAVNVTYQPTVNLFNCGLMNQTFTVATILEIAPQ